MQAPDVFHHGDFRQYLEAWFAWRKARNRRYSYRLFSRRLGSSDPSLLLNIVKGRRRLSVRLLDDFVRVLALEGDAAAYFRALVHHGQARDAQARERAWAEMSEIRSRARRPELDGDRLRYATDRLYPTVRTLAECDGFRPEPAWIGAHLRPAVTEESAAEAIELLLRMGLLVREGDRLVISEPVVRTGTNVDRYSSFAYHAQNIELAREVLEQVRVSRTVDQESGFLGATIAVPSDRLLELRALLYEHLGKVLHTCESWPDRERVVQVNVQMFAVSESTDS